MKTMLKKTLSVLLSLCMLFAVVSCLSGSISFMDIKASAAGTLVSKTAIGSILSGQQAVYNAEINYSGSDEVELKFGDTQLFHIKGDALTVGTRLIGGSYKKGTYKIQSVICREQNMLTVKVTIPDGGIITRGYPELLGGKEMNIYVTGSSKVNKATLHSEDYNYNAYSVSSSAPKVSGIKTKIYNIVTSFNEASTTRNFAWTVKADFLNGGTMELKYRKKGTDKWTFVTAIKENELAETADEDYFKCDISGLTPDTQYEFAIGKKGGDESSEWTKSYKFKTAKKNIDEFSFIAIGDTQGTDDWYYHKYTMAALEEAFDEVKDPAFLLHTGDVVEDGRDKSHWNMFFKALGNYAIDTPLFTTVGNHDGWKVEDVNKDPFYFDYHFNNPNNGGSAALDQSAKNQLSHTNLTQFFGQNGDETIYSFDYGNAHFIVLNTGSINDPYTKSRDRIFVNAQRAWLIKDLEANKDAKWTIMMFHAPVYSYAGENHSSDFLNDIIESYGVDLVLQGHAHLVSRTYPMKNGKIVTKAVDSKIEKGLGTIYTTIGATKPDHTNFSSYKTHDESASLVVTPADAQPTYTTVSVNDSKILVTIKQVNGFIVDSFTIRDSSVAEIPFSSETKNNNTTSDNTSSKAPANNTSKENNKDDNDNNNTTSSLDENVDTTSENTTTDNPSNDVVVDDNSPEENKINPAIWLLLLIPILGGGILVFFLVKRKKK